MKQESGHMIKYRIRMWCLWGGKGGADPSGEDEGAQISCRHKRTARLHQRGKHYYILIVSFCFKERFQKRLLLIGRRPA